MKYQQRDLVFIKEEELPDGSLKDHPFLIISCRAASSKENYYTCIMMTGSPVIDLFSFRVDDEMFEAPLKKKDCQLRLYILNSIQENKISNLMNRMKSFYFKKVLDQIKEYVLIMDT
jgi:hypothetical protein